VNIQYRLGAFGFLASDEVKRKGVLNAGLLDQMAALKWVKEHIGKFGGDAGKVTNFGISTGGKAKWRSLARRDKTNGL
jgi:carboxylesterase type B